MLVLSRKPGEQVRIGKNTYITILASTPGAVRVGIVSPEVVTRPEKDNDQTPAFTGSEKFDATA